MVSKPNTVRWAKAQSLREHLCELNTRKRHKFPILRDKLPKNRLGVIGFSSAWSWCTVIVQQNLSEWYNYQVPSKQLTLVVHRALVLFYLILFFPSVCVWVTLILDIIHLPI